MSKWIIFFGLVLLFPARGDEFLIGGSESPNHRYEVYAVDGAGVAHLEMREKSTGRVIADLGSSGWVLNAKGLAIPGNTAVLWNSSGTLFALKMRDTKTSSSVTLYQCTNQKVSKISLPDFSKAVRKQMNLDFDGRFYFESPVNWNDDNRLILNIAGNTVDSIDPDGEYDFSYNMTVEARSGQIVHIEEIKKALPPPPRNK